MNEKTIVSTTHRTIKIKVFGDTFRKKTCPKIRLQGKWLEELGFKQAGRVEIIPIAPGEVTLRCVEESIKPDTCQLNEAPLKYGKKL